MAKIEWDVLQHSSGREYGSRGIDDGCIMWSVSQDSRPRHGTASRAGVGEDIEEDVGVEQAVAGFLKSGYGRNIALMHAAAREEQKHFAMRPICPIERFVLPQEAVIAHQLPPRLRILEGRIEAHRRAAVGSKLGDRGANAHTFIFAQGEWFI